jgi:uncharacterized membrane protein YidH (DUF202 family)
LLLNIMLRRAGSRFALRRRFWSPPTLVENTGSIARDILATERTFLAWARTGLGFVGAGSALFAAYHRQSDNITLLLSSGSALNFPDRWLHRDGCPAFLRICTELKAFLIAGCIGTVALLRIFRDSRDGVPLAGEDA